MKAVVRVITLVRRYDRVGPIKVLGHRGCRCKHLMRHNLLSLLGLLAAENHVEIAYFFGEALVLCSSTGSSAATTIATSATIGRVVVIVAFEVAQLGELDDPWSRSGT